jgi:hypothetical protein
MIVVIAVTIQDSSISATLVRKQWLEEQISVGQKISKLSSLISKYENCVKWNNPGCLIYKRQPGSKGNKRGFAEFDTLQEGKQALENDIRAKLARGMSVGEILEVWCNGECGYEDKIIDLL